MPTYYPENFIGPLPTGSSRVGDVPMDPGEIEAFYGTTPKAGEQVGYDAPSNTYIQSVGGQEVARSQPVSTPSSTSSSGSSSGGGFSASSALANLGYANKNAFKEATGYSSVEEYLNKRGEISKDIEAAYNPIISELDRRLGQLPGRESEYKGQVGGLAQMQLEDVETQRVRGEEKLQAEKKRGLRDLESDIRNMLEASGRYIGVAGAGSSSAIGRASEAITRAGQKSRGNLIETVAGKLADINNLASQQRNQIQQWKSNKLFEVTQYFQIQVDNINQQLVNARGEKARALVQLKKDIQSDYTEYLINLDNNIRQYQQTVDLWEKQRAAELQDYATKLSLAASASSPEFKEALSMFNTLVQSGSGADEARTFVESSYGILLPASLTGLDEDTYKPLTSPITGAIIGQYDPANPLGTTQYTEGYNPNNPYGIQQGG